MMNNTRYIKSSHIHSVLTLLLVFLLFSAVTVSAESNPPAAYTGEGTAAAHTVAMEPGTVHDLSQDGDNTAVYLVKPGSYIFTGKSDTTCIYIQSQDVSLILKDGVHMDLNPKANKGLRASPITVENMGGTVNIKTEANASVYLGGYMSPAIRKDGTSTMLVLDTLDPDQPGRLICKGGVDCPAIGDVPYVMGDHWTGNITFRNGIVEATAGGSSSSISIHFGTAGIGGGRSCGLCNCYIQSGQVTAKGTGVGAAIGGGYGGGARNIVISGGAVKAVTTEGAGAAIGGGYEGDAKNITVSGGVLDLNGYGNGIGGGGNASGDGIYIQDGVIRIVSEQGNGIGAGGSFDGNDGGLSNVHISGGYITLNVAQSAIGNCRANLAKHPKCSVTITGGTIHQVGKAGNYGIGCKNTDIVITGGNICLNGKHGICYTTPTDGSGTHAALTTLTLEGCEDDTAVSVLLKIRNGQPEGTGYSVHQMHTIGDKLYLYLGKDENIWSVTTADGQLYYAKDNPDTGIVQGKSGTLARATKLTLDCNASHGGTENGSGYLLIGKKTVYDYKPARGNDGLELMHYQIYAGEILLNADGTLRSGIPGYTDTEGRWIRENQPSLTLYAGWSTQKIRLAFDPNSPAEATFSVTGQMDAMTAERGQTLTLDPCAYRLPGWGFAGWTLKPDGSSGVLYEDQAVMTDPVLTFGRDITLYAQWEPLTYTVTFDGDGADGAMTPQTLHWDQTETLAPNTFTMTGAHFLHWRKLTLGGSSWNDGASVRNLTTLDENGQPRDIRLMAVWVTGSGVYIIPERNGHLITGLESTLALTDSSLVIKGFNRSDDFYYISDVPEGTYNVTLSDDYSVDDSLTVSENDTVTLRLSFTDIRISGDEHSDGVRLTTEKGIEGDSALIRVNEPVQIQAGAKPGYSFQQWISRQISPVWESTPFSAEQTILPRGETELYALTHLNTYTLRFDPNGGIGMMDTLSLACGETVTLPTCAFGKTHHTFAGWTLSPVWSDPLFKDGAAVSDLTDRDGVTLTLYAQWTPGFYSIRYNGSRQAETPTQKCFFGIPSPLLDCAVPDPGWYFAGWNTSPDGTGIHFARDAEILDLATDEGQTVDLWAQWALIPLPKLNGPQSVIVSEQENAVYNVTVSGTAPFTFDWEVDDGNGFRPVSVKTQTGQNTALSTGKTKPTDQVSNSYTVKAELPMNGWRYRCIVTDSFGRKAVSDEAYLTVIKKPPKTGDTATPILWTLVLLCSGIVLYLDCKAFQKHA